MVIKLKEYGKYVIGVGIRESSSDLLIQNCDEYYSYNDLAGLTKEVDAPSAQRDPWQLAGEAVAQMARNGDVMRADRLKQVMQQIDPNFDERNAGFNRFSKFVVEAGQKGMLAVSKLENGQYEVAPLVDGVAVAPVPRAEEPAREEGPRRGRSRRGGRGRDRERPAEAAREEGARPPREARADGALSLARAFQLMSQALGELRPPVGHEPLRLRMAALHGKQDALLDPARFSRLLRQANDAEVADVRKVGDDEYEISPHRTGGTPAPQAHQSAGAPAPTPAFGESAPIQVEAVSEPASSAAPQNGQRFGVRFRRGSRSPMRPGDVPLVGVVEIDIPASLVPQAVAAEAPPAEPSVAEKPVRPRRAPRKKAAASAATVEAPAPPEAAPPPKPKRPRPRPRKKSE